MSSDIKNILDQYIKLDDELKIINKQCSALKTKKKLLGEQVNDYLATKPDRSAIEMGKNTFTLVKYKKKKLNKNIMEDILKEKLKEEELKTIMDDLTEETDESYLRRVVKK